MEIPTPPDGNATQRLSRRVPNTVKVGIPMTAIGSCALFALGWAYSVDKAQTIDHLRIENAEKAGDSLRTDLKEVLQKLDTLKEIVLRK